MRFLSIILLLALGTDVALANPFGGPSSAPSSETLSWVPHFLMPIVAKLVPLQRTLITQLQGQIDLIRDGKAPLGAFAIIAIGTIYGIVHSAGPGHGKMVMGSYFSTRKAKIRQVFVASSSIALVQAISAILIVTVITVLLDVGTHWLLDNAGWFDVVSFGLIGLFGVIITIRSLLGKTCDDEHGHDHGHADCGHDHDHGHAHGHDVHHTASSRELMWGGLVVGMRPCTGAILILLFTFSNGLYWLGILSTLAMAAGTAVTVASISLGAVGVRSVATQFFGRIGAATASRKTIRLVGGIVIAAVGLMMMAATLSTIG